MSILRIEDRPDRHALTTFRLLHWFLAVTASLGLAAASYPEWAHSGSLYILTTAEGAALPAAAAEEGFPLLVRLHRDFFDFSQARPGGEDVRFATRDGTPLPYEIEAWDAAAGTASIWVRLPTIRGDTRQELRIHWGNPTATTESRGAAVFNATNGYLSVWHMADPVRDAVGTLTAADTGTGPTAGVIGLARHLAGNQGLACGDRITSFPTGASAHTSQAWFRADKPNGRLLAWGNEKPQGKVVLEFRSPPHITLDCYFAGANVQSTTTLGMAQWYHVVHTCEQGNSRVYVNGHLDGISTNARAPLAIQRPARMWIGGWYDDYNFVGDLDEVRVSNRTRSADWVRLEYENQQPLQTLVGPVVQPGDRFAVVPTQATVLEGTPATFSAEAGGAQKLYWLLVENGRETVVAVDRFHFTFTAGRVAGNQRLTLRCRAVYPEAVRTQDIPITIEEAIPEPVFTLPAPATWDGRKPIEIVPRVANLSLLRAKGAADLNVTWSLSNLAVIKETGPAKLILKRAQNSGRLSVTASVHNGGAPRSQTVTIVVKEPRHDAWVPRAPARDEKPEDNQFYARDDRNAGTLFCCGSLTEPADAVFLDVYADDRLYRHEQQRPGAGKAYAFSVRLKPGLIRYRVEFGQQTGGRRTVLHTATNLVCGDAYLINGQSNAVATDWGSEETPAFSSDWIRTFGSMAGDAVGLRLWGNAVYRSREAEKLQIGYWGMELARRLVANHRVPICIINGAVGGTRIDQHQRNPEHPTDPATIYGRLLWRVREARLTHGIRGVIWHQGENDQGADGPTGGYGWETYRQYFIDLAAAWKQDYPNLQQYYLFQIWPKSCAMGINGSDNRLREVQRTLPTAFSHMHIMSTLGIQPPGGCHYPAAGYAEFARLLGPLLERDFYGVRFPSPISPPNLESAAYASAAHDEILLRFDQAVRWDQALVSQFQLDGVRRQVAAGAAVGNFLRLKLSSPSTARTLTYLDSQSWNPTNVLRGVNGIAALTFCEVPIESRPPSR